MKPNNSLPSTDNLEIPENLEDNENIEIPTPEEDEDDGLLYEHFRIVADRGQVPTRVDKFAP